MAPLLFLIITLLLPGSHGDVTTMKDVVVLEGRSVTIPCHYDPQYTRHVKFWCRGATWSFCSSLARTDTALSAGSKLSISDDPAHQVFTVTMSDLEEGDSGWYWCGVEVGGMWRADDAAAVYITVSHGMSVVNSMLVGEEGGSVSAECHYGIRHSGSSKKWCRSGDWGSCLEVAANSTVAAGLVQLSDDGAGLFTITVRALEPGDSGWYWCAAGQQQVQVHIAVTPRSSTQHSVRTSLPIMTSLPASPLDPSAPVATNPVHTANQGQNSASHVFESPLMICGVLLLLVIVATIPWKMWRQFQRIHKRRHRGEKPLTLAPHPGGEGDQSQSGVIFFSSSPQQVHLL